jgi:4-amino-4-deoxy-L-arabinose transferase-like glycosyltransferase
MVLAAVLALAGLGARGIWESDEGRYVGAGVRMADSGDWLTPRLDLDVPHLTKPPLTYWSVAASTQLFGRSEFAARLPNALAFLLTVLVLLRLGPDFAPQRPWLPALIYASAPVTVLGASIVTTDTLLTLFEVAAVAAWWWSRAPEGRERAADRRWILAMWLAFGLGFMTKGPPALLPLLAILVFHLLRGRAVPGERAALRALFAPAGLLLFLLVAGWWFAVMIARDPALAGWFAGREFVERIATDVHGRNPEWYAPFTVYLPQLAFGLLPWVLLARPRLQWREASAERLWLGLWFLLPLSVFCIAQSRQHAYLLPLFAPFALALGRGLAPRFDLAARGAQAVLVLAVALTLGLKLWLGQWTYYKDSRLLRDQLVAEAGLSAGERLLFVDRWPQWGLRFYLPVAIGHVERVDQACGALAPAGRTVLVTRAERADALSAALGNCGMVARRLPTPHFDALVLVVAR